MKRGESHLWCVPSGKLLFCRLEKLTISNRKYIDSNGCELPLRKLTGVQPKNTHHPWLVGGFNPFEKYARQIGFISPNRGKNKWHQHRPQTVQVNELNQIALTTSFLFVSFSVQFRRHNQRSRFCIANSQFIFQLVLLCWNCKVVVGGLHCCLCCPFEAVLVAATAASLLLLPFRSLHITLFEHGIAQNHVSFTNARLCFAQAPWYTSGIDMQINTKTNHTQKAKSAPNPHQSQTPRPTQPSAPNTAKSHAQPSPARPAQPNPRPTQHSAPTSVSSLFFSKIEPHR